VDNLPSNQASWLLAIADAVEEVKAEKMEK